MGWSKFLSAIDAVITCGVAYFILLSCELSQGACLLRFMISDPTQTTHTTYRSCDLITTDQEYPG